MTMMISKFHKLIQSKIVWGAFAVLISVAFVGVYTPGAKNRNQAKREQKEGQLAGRLFGEEVSRIEFGRAYQSVYVTYTMMLGRAINITEEIDEAFRTAAWQRIATLKKAQQLGMTVTKQQTIDIIQRQPIFRNQQTGQFDKNAYNAFISQFLPRTGLGAKDLENLFSEQVLIEKVSQIPAQGGLVSEEEIKKAFHLYTDMLTVEYASIPRSLAGTPDVSEEEARAYFKKNQAQFLMPKTVLVEYVQFSVSNYLDQVEVADEMVAQIYENNKQRYLKEPAEGAAEDAAPEFKPLEEVRGEITGEIKVALARKAAADRADELVSELADESTTFEKAVEQAGLTIIGNTPKFSLTDPVKGIDPTAPFARAAFALEKNDTHYYSDPVVGRDWVYVISLVKKFDSFPPSFELVREDATEAAKLTAAEMAYVEKAEQIRREIATALKAGTSFAEVAGKQKLEMKTTVPFNVTSRLEDEFGQEIMAATARFEQGALTGLIPTPSEFIVAYIAKKELGDEAVALPGMRAQLASGIGNEKSGHLVAAWRESLLNEAGFEDLMNRTDDES